MRRLLVIFTFILWVGCGTSVSKNDLHLLNGYWQITEVEFGSGNKKAYKMGKSVDFIFLEDGKGYRKKVHPNILGGFDTSDDAQNFEVAITDNSFSMVYENNLSNWSERLLALNENSFTVSNEEGVIYRYQRYEPINLDE